MMRLWRRAHRPADPVPRCSATISRIGGYPVNEDATGSVESGGLALYALADGLGGHARGDVAARLAIERSLSMFRARPSLETACLEALVRGAHLALAEEHRADLEGNGIRSTLVLLVMDGASARWVHVGDSRLYHFRNGALAARTADHSVPELLRRGGEIQESEIRGHPDRNRLLQALGQSEAPRPAISDAVPLEAGDAFLLCSDGWWEGVDEAAMVATLGDSAEPAAWLARMRDEIERSGHGGQDNYTALAVMVG